MSQAVDVNFRLDEEVEKNMETVSVDSFYSENNIRYLENKMEDYKAGRLKLRNMN